MKNRNMITDAFPIALFAFAGRALTVGRGRLVDGIAATFLALAVVPMAAWAANSVFGAEERTGVGGRILYVFFASFAAVAAIFIASVSAKEFSAFAAEVMFLRVSPWGVTAIFLGFCAYLSSKGGAAVRKFSFLAFVITATAAVLLFLLSVPNFEMPTVRTLLNIKELSADGVTSALGGIFAPAVLAVIYISAVGRREKNKVRPMAAALAVLLSAAFLLICFLNVSLLLGEDFGRTRDYPYSEAVSTVTAGKLFARMEGFSYLMYYSAAAVKTAISVSLICLVIKDMLPKRWKNKRVMLALPYAVSASVAAVSFIL